ncbi:MAG: MBL fold metallo-hydrolase, partial [Bdellovibrionales bacterium]|nr:MBL fold metallo-hydrolase [Bdellovibrionales bacterium]
KEDPLKVLKNILERIISKNGILLIPSFAVGRAQSLIYAFHKIFDSYPNLKIPMYLNSPMASDVTELYEQYPDEHKLTKKQYYNLFQDIHIVNSLDESKALNQKTGPIIIISASGMLSGGRILHHLKAYSAGENNAILLVGFQAPGTRGHNLQQGNRILKIHGQEYKVNAEVFEIDNLSAHADQEELLKWLNSSSLEGIKKVFLVHGEKEASTEIEKIINETLLLKTSIPSPGDKFDL